MGFSPAAFRAGPALADRTTVEDSEATLALASRGILVRALPAPAALEENAGDAVRSARVARRHARLLLVSAGDLARLAVRKPWGALVLAFDLWLRPRTLVLGLVVLLALLSTALSRSADRTRAWVRSSSSRSRGERSSSRRTRSRSRGARAGLSALTAADARDAAAMWPAPRLRALRAPTRWHRARPPAGPR